MNTDEMRHCPLVMKLVWRVFGLFQLMIIDRFKFLHVYMYGRIQSSFKLFPCSSSSSASISLLSSSSLSIAFPFPLEMRALCCHSVLFGLSSLALMRIATRSLGSLRSIILEVLIPLRYVKSSLSVIVAALILQILTC